MTKPIVYQIKRWPDGNSMRDELKTTEHMHRLFDPEWPPAVYRLRLSRISGTNGYELEALSRMPGERP